MDNYYTREQVKDLLTKIVEEADADLIQAIKSKPQERDQLLAQLDALETVRGRLYANFD